MSELNTVTSLTTKACIFQELQWLMWTELIIEIRTSPITPSTHTALNIISATLGYFKICTGNIQMSVLGALYKVKRKSCGDTVHAFVCNLRSETKLSDFHHICIEFSTWRCQESTSFVRTGSMSHTFLMGINFCLQFTHFLTNFGEIWYSRASCDAIQQLWVSWKLVQWKPHFTLGSKWTYIRTSYSCLIWVKVHVTDLSIMLLSIYFMKISAEEEHTSLMCI